MNTEIKFELTEKERAKLEYIYTHSFFEFECLLHTLKWDRIMELFNIQVFEVVHFTIFIHPPGKTYVCQKKKAINTHSPRTN